MGTEVAVESDPRLEGPGTVRAWEETGIAGSISRRLSSFPGLLDLCLRYQDRDLTYYLS